MSQLIPRPADLPRDVQRDAAVPDPAPPSKEPPNEATRTERRLERGRSVVVRPDAICARGGAAVSAAQSKYFCSSVVLENDVYSSPADGSGPRLNRLLGCELFEFPPVSERGCNATFTWQFL